MSDTIDIVFTVQPFPLLDNFYGSEEDFSKLFVFFVQGTTEEEGLMPGQIGGVAPPFGVDIGPWASGMSWSSFSAALFGYTHNLFIVGNKDNLVTIGGAGPRDVNRTILVQDKSGIAALQTDLYTPRQTYPVFGGANITIDWNASDSFYIELTQDALINMINSRHGQEVYIAIHNPALWSVNFASYIGFEGGIHPTQTKFPISTVTPILTRTGSNLIIAWNFQAAFIKADEGLPITTAGNTPIPAGTVISQVIASTHALISQPCAANQDNATVTIANRLNVGRTDLWIFKNVGGSIYGRVVHDYPGGLRVAGDTLSAWSLAEILPDPPPPALPVLQPPVFDPQPGHESQTPGDMIINMSVVAPAVAIRYTIDGTTPTAIAGILADSVHASYILAQGEQVEIIAVAVGPDNSTSSYKRAKYSNVYTVPIVPTAPIDNADTGQARVDTGAEGGLMPTKT